MIPWEAGKTEYTENEAAALLGVTLEELRALVREHVVSEESDSDGAVACYRPTDLLLLRMLREKEALAS